MGDTVREINNIKKLQKRLETGGYLSGDYTFGKLDSATEAAIKKMQSDNRLAITGKVDVNKGDDTWFAALDAAHAKKAEKNATTTPSIPSKPTYTSKWQTQLDDTINRILNREKFSYDLNGDTLYQQYKNKYIQQGKLAMQDTMGQAQAMTGGYGNSYAHSVGQQAYNAQLENLNDIVPELYQLAYDKHNQGTQDLYNQASILMTEDGRDYSKYRDEVDDYITDRTWDYNLAQNDAAKYYTGVTDDIKDKLASFENVDEAGVFLDTLEMMGVINSSDADGLYNSVMETFPEEEDDGIVDNSVSSNSLMWQVQHPEQTDWIVVDYGGGNGVGIDANAKVKIGEDGDSMTLAELKEKLIDEGASSFKATAAIYSLLLKIADNGFFGL